MSAIVIAAVSCVLLTYVFGRLEPFHCTTELLTKPVPLTVSVNAGPPGVAEGGLSPVMVGTGFETAATAAPAFTMPLPQVEVLQELPPGKLVTVFCKIVNTSAGVSDGLRE